MIKRVGQRKWIVMSADGKKALSKPMSHARAVQRLHQVEYFKHKGQ